MRIGILGCGYLGCAISERLVGDGHDVIGVRRSTEGLSAIEATGAHAKQGDLRDPTSLETLPALDALVITAGTGGGDAKATRRLAVEGVQTAIEQFGSRPNPPARLVYTSTTGVYGDHNGAWVDEQTRLAPSAAKTAVYAEAELMCREISSRYEIEPIIARLGGIYGPERYRIDRYLDRPIVPGYRNLIHREDCAGAISRFITQGAAGFELINVVDDEPVERTTFVKWLAEKVGQSPPPTMDSDEYRRKENPSLAALRRLNESKRCDNSRLHRTGYELQYPNFRAGYASAIPDFVAE